MLESFALALEEDVSEAIRLRAQTREKLLDLVDQREIDALDIALRTRDLPAAERAAQLAPFRAESERLGLRLLTAVQRRSLQAIRARRAGLQTLVEPNIATQLSLSDEQLAEARRLITERNNAMQNGNRRSIAGIRDTYERQLRALITEQQFAQWEQATAVASSKSAVPAGATDFTAAENATSTVRLGMVQPGDGLSASDGRMIFSFRYAPWQTVLDWFASHADLSLVMDAPPQGTFNYTDAREYTPAQAIDLLNSVLLTKGFTLIRHQRMLMLINLEDGIPPNLVSDVPLDELDDRGEYELIRCLFSLERMSPEDAEQEVGKLIGPQGNVVALPAARQIVVTETAGRLRTIRKVIDAIEGRGDGSSTEAKRVSLRYVKAADVIVPIRQLMGLAKDEDSAPDGTIRIAMGPDRRQLLATGRPHRMRQLDELVKLLDVPPGGAVGGAIDTPQLEVYAVTDADPTSVLEVMQTLLAGMDDVRLASDPVTGNLVALARPAQHETIRATLEQMQQDRRQLEVIRLQVLDPQLAMMSIEKLFSTGADDETVDVNAPRVDADPTSRSLLIRGSLAQIADIRELLEKMGESGTSDPTSLARGRGNVRMLPITGAMARRVLEQVNEIWPSVRENRIRTVTPSNSLRSIRPRRGPFRSSPMNEEPTTGTDEINENVTPTSPTSGDPSATSDDRPASTIASTNVAWSGDIAMAFAGQLTAPDSSDSEDAIEAESPPADIVVTPGQQGILIASDDIEALDEFERLVRALADRLFTGSRELAIFYLKYAKAEVISDMLKQFFGAGGGETEGGGGGSLLSSLAGAALGGGEGGGGLIGSLLGLGGDVAKVSLRSDLTIIPDTRLNALLIQATPEELDMAEQLLEVLDKEAGPEVVQTTAAPRMIPVYNTDAEDIASIVRNVYANRISGRGGQSARQPTPEEFIRAMSGQRNRRQSMQDAVRDQVRMTVSVDSRRNSLIVVAPESLFLEVETLVTQLDLAVPELQETIRTVTISRSNPQTIRRALSAIVGESVRTTDKAGAADARRASPDGTNRPGRTDQGLPGQPSREEMREQIRARMEFLNLLQRAGRQGGSGRPNNRPGRGSRAGQ